MTIMQLKPSQRVKGRWLATLDDGSLLRLGEQQVLEFALYTGMELSEDTAQALVEATRQSGLKEKAMTLAAGRPLSRREVERKLRSWEAGEEETAAICDRLEELSLLNDGEYARTLARHYRAKGYGDKKIREELRLRGVPREHWDGALEELEGADEAIDDFLRRKLKGEQPDPKELKKVSDALVRRGFSWGEVRDGLARYGARVWDLE